MITRPAAAVSACHVTKAEINESKNGAGLASVQDGDSVESKLPNEAQLQNDINNAKTESSHTIDLLIQNRLQLQNKRARLPDLSYIVAPMVGASDLAFRLLCRKYGATLAFTPMFYSDRFNSSNSSVDDSSKNGVSYFDQVFETCESDQPLIVQFCGNSSQTLLQAALMVEDKCAGVDINLGCPQREARNMVYGGYLLSLEHREKVLEIVRVLSSRLKIPVSCKIRLMDDLESTIALVKGLEAAGCAWITVHGRTVGNPLKRRDGPADLEAIRTLVKAVRIPVVANGNVRNFGDVQKNLQTTRAAGIMAAESLLQDPSLFKGTPVDRFVLAYEYLKFAKHYPPPIDWAIRHINKIVKEPIQHCQLHDRLFACTSIRQIRDILVECRTSIQHSFCAPVTSDVLNENELDSISG